MLRPSSYKRHIPGKHYDGILTVMLRLQPWRRQLVHRYGSRKPAMPWHSCCKQRQSALEPRRGYTTGRRTAGNGVLRAQSSNTCVNQRYLHMTAPRGLAQVSPIDPLGPTRDLDNTHQQVSIRPTRRTFTTVRGGIRHGTPEPTTVAVQVAMAAT